MAEFCDDYLAERKDEPLMIVDLGSCDYNGSYRPIFARKPWRYLGVDLAPGKNVDLVLREAYHWRELARLMADALRTGDVDALGALVGEHWTHQRALHPAITTETIDIALGEARRAGALGGKALGASGGGCVVAIAGEGRETAVRAAMAGVVELLEVRIDMDGLRVAIA